MNVSSQLATYTHVIERRVSEGVLVIVLIRHKFSSRTGVEFSGRFCYMVVCVSVSQTGDVISATGFAFVAIAESVYQLLFRVDFECKTPHICIKMQAYEQREASITASIRDYLNVN